MFQRDQPELCAQMKRHSSHHLDSSTNKQTALPLVGAVVATKQAAIIHSNTKHQSEVVSCLQQMKCSEQTATDVAHNRTHGFNCGHVEAPEWQMKGISKQVGTVPKNTATSGLIVLLEAVDRVQQQHQGKKKGKRHNVNNSSSSQQLTNDDHMRQSSLWDNSDDDHYDADNDNESSKVDIDIIMPSKAVKKVTVTGNTYECEEAAGMLVSPGGMEQGIVGNGNKRKKMNILPDWAPSSEFAVVPNGGVDDLLFSGVADPLPDLAMSSSTVLSPMSDQGIHLMNPECTKIGDQGVEKLAGALDYNNSIRELWLRGNQISNSALKRIYAIMKYTGRREREELTSQQWREIIAMKDEEIADNVKAIVKQDRIIAQKDEVIACLKDSLVNSKPTIDTVDLTVINSELNNNKRQRIDNSPENKKSLASILLDEKSQKLVQVKEEKIAAVTALEDTKEDLEDTREEFGNQVLYVNFLQGKIEELTKLAEAAGADRSKIAKIKGRLYSST